MDNLTHSLVGALLGQAGLKRRTGLAMPALILGANLPDIDAACVFWLDGVQHLGFRRGITHGPIAMVVLPLLLATALWWFNRWQTRRSKRPEGRLPVRFGWLYSLSFLACLTHPFFDWFNNYGIRLLEPFSSQWLYGDALFIIDPWIIAMLGVGIWLSRQQEQADSVDWHAPARTTLKAVAAYVFLNMAISDWSHNVGRWYETHARLSVANAKPFKFWEREVLLYGNGFFGGGFYYYLDCNAFGGCETRTDDQIESVKDSNMFDPRIALWAKGDPAAEAFLFWSRMPIAELHEDRIVLRDQRFMDSPVADRFMVTLRPPR